MACKSSGGSSFSEALSQKAENDMDDCERRAALLHESCVRRQRRVRVASYLLAMARACATKRSLSSWTSYKKGLVDSGKSCGVLVVSPLIALMHAYAGEFTQTSSVKPNPFANVTIKIDLIFTFKLNACANSVYQAFPPRLKAWVRG